MKCERLSEGMYRKHHSKGPGTAVLESNKSVELICRTGGKVPGGNLRLKYLNVLKMSLWIIIRLQYAFLFQSSNMKTPYFKRGKKNKIFFIIFILLKLLSPCLINKDLMITSGIAMALLVIACLTLHCCIIRLMISVTNINGIPY